jgi:hypothetical protein
LQAASQVFIYSSLMLNAPYQERVISARPEEICGGGPKVAPLDPLPPEVLP